MPVNTKEVSYRPLPFFLAKVVRQPACASAMEFKSWLWSFKLYSVYGWKGGVIEKRACF